MFPKGLGWGETVQWLRVLLHKDFSIDTQHTNKGVSMATCAHSPSTGCEGLGLKKESPGLLAIRSNGKL